MIHIYIIVQPRYMITFIKWYPPKMLIKLSINVCYLLQIPEFDNLYLDMNGIVHICSHPDDGNPHFRITEEKIFEDIFHYLEVCKAAMRFSCRSVVFHRGRLNSNTWMISVDSSQNLPLSTTLNLETSLRKWTFYKYFCDPSLIPCIVQCFL